MLYSTFQCYNIAPPCGGVLTPKVMLDGIGKDIGFTLAIFLCVLLGAKDDCLTAVYFVDVVDDFIQALHLLELLGVIIKQVHLDGTVGANAHDYHSGFLVLIALNEYLLQYLVSRLHYVYGAACRNNEPLLLKVPVLRQVLPEEVGVDEYTDDACHRVLCPQFLSTTCGIVADMGFQCVEVTYHAREASAGADAFLFCHLFIGYGIYTVQLLPCAGYHYVVEYVFYPIAVMLCEVVGSLDSHCLQLGSISSPYAPNIIYWEKLQSFDALLVIVYHAAMAIAFILLGEVTGHLCQCLSGSNTYADRHPDTLSDALVQMLAPCFQIHAVDALPIDKALVNAVPEISWSFLPDYFHYPACEFSVQLIVTGEHCYLLVRKLLGKLEVWSSGFDAHLLGFVAAGYDTAVIVAQHNNGLAVQVGPKHPLTAHIAIITVNDAKHLVLIQNEHFSLFTILFSLQKEASVPLFDSPNHHSPYLELIVLFYADGVILLVGWAQLDVAVCLVLQV